MYAGNGDWVPSSYKSWVKALSYVIRKSLLQTAKEVKLKLDQLLLECCQEVLQVGVNITNNQDS